jgi:hypothetical protein
LSQSNLPDNHNHEINPVPAVSQIGVPMFGEAHGDNFAKAFDSEHNCEKSAAFVYILVPNC